MSDNENSSLSLSQIARSVYDACDTLDWQISNPQDLVNRLILQQNGLRAEDEFLALISWLGKCQLIHKLDQKQFPLGSKDLYQVPDFLTVFKYEQHLLPVLIEVKTRTSQISKSLVLKAGYHEKLKRYAELLNLPLLIAWKIRIQDTNLFFWLLIDIDIFKKSGDKYEVTFQAAYGENLLSLLAGDFMIILKSGASLNFELSPIGDTWKSDYLNTTGSKFWGKVRVFGAKENGNEIPDMKDDGLSRGLFSILQCIPLFGSNSSYTTESTINWNWKLDESIPLYLHQIMPIVLAESTSIQNGWGKVLRKKYFSVTSEEILKAAERSGIIERQIGQIPKTIPAFLQSKPG